MERLHNELDRRLVVVESEAERTRARLHRLESDRRSLQALVKTTQKLAEQTAILAAKVTVAVDQAEQLVEAAAERAVEKAYGRRVEHHWRLVTRIGGTLASIAAVGSLIAYLFMH